jgi:hypothetical protein
MLEVKNDFTGDYFCLNSGVQNTIKPVNIIDITDMVISTIGAPHRSVPNPARKLPNGRVPIAKARTPETRPLISSDDCMRRIDCINAIDIPWVTPVPTSKTKDKGRRREKANIIRIAGQQRIVRISIFPLVILAGNDAVVIDPIIAPRPTAAIS